VASVLLQLINTKEQIVSTKIEWTNKSWNPIVGCSKISAGCKNCYAAEAASSPRLQQFSQYQSVKDWDGTIEFVESQLNKPLTWRSPQKIFVCSMSDLFHENVEEEWLDRIFAIMALCSRHTFQILTKRPERMKEYFEHESRLTRISYQIYEIQRKEREWSGKQINFQHPLTFPLPNVWLGTSVENQKAADDRIPLLLRTPAAVRFLSCEPLLEKVFLKPEWLGKLNWLIVGGESGTGARQCHLDWLRSIVTQCQTANVAVFVKQLGSKPIDCNNYIIDVANNNFSLKLKDRKGGDISEFPEDLQIREFP